MSKTDGTPLSRDERQRLAFTVGGWGVRPCSNREGPEPDPTCERIDCRVWYRQGMDSVGHDGEETLYTVCDELPLDMDTALAWLKNQDRMVHITGGTPSHMWQVRVSKPGEGYREFIPLSHSRNAPRLEDAILRAAFDIMEGVIP